MSKYPWLDKEAKGHGKECCLNIPEVRQSIISHIEKAKPKEIDDQKFKEFGFEYAIGRKDGHNFAIKDYENNLKGQDE